MTDNRLQGRRSLLKRASAGLLILRPQTVFGSQANSTVEVGVIGCGGRGNYVGGLFGRAGARVVALGDALSDNLALTRDKFNVPAASAFAGFDSYRGVLSSKVDAVVIEIPPVFHPEIVSAAVAAGKHVYLAKPVAVDVPGSLSILESGRRARSKVSFLVDFQVRAHPLLKEAASRLWRGDIGAPVIGDFCYHAREQPWRERPGVSADEERLRNWYTDRALGGDLMLQRDIHVVDAANWYLRAHPLRAEGTGGRIARKSGNTWDHFIVTFFYPNAVKVSFSSSDVPYALRNVSMRLYCGAGTLDSSYNGPISMTGATPWKGVEMQDTGGEGSTANVKSFLESIRAGKPINNVEESVESTLTVILGRNAAYSHSSLTWEKMLESRERFEPRLRL